MRSESEGKKLKIDYKSNPPRYYDVNNVEIRDGDTVLINGKEKKVYLAEDNYLGTDATNPKWIETGRAVECEFGIYPFDEDDEPKIIVRNKRWFQFV